MIIILIPPLIDYSLGMFRFGSFARFIYSTDFWQQMKPLNSNPRTFVRDDVHDD